MQSLETYEVILRIPELQDGREKERERENLELADSINISRRDYSSRDVNRFGIRLGNRHLRNITAKQQILSFALLAGAY